MPETTLDTDVIYLNAPLERSQDLKFINFISENKAHDNLILILTTGGGSPDAAFKISRYLQDSYKKFSCLIPGFCKSAGTLLSLGAHELIFTPYGELGPLDVQMSKTDNLVELDSGLNIQEAIFSLSTNAATLFHAMALDIIERSNGVVSYQTAASVANDHIEALFGPIFGRIDPEEVGARARAMRIGTEYGKRLNDRSRNLKDGALQQLAKIYPSHSFVIDLAEARSLFCRVREASQEEIALLGLLSDSCCLPTPGMQIRSLTEELGEIRSKVSRGDDDGDEGYGESVARSTDSTISSTNGSGATA